MEGLLSTGPTPSSLEKNPFVLKFFTEDCLNGFPLCFKDPVYIIHPEYYLTFQSSLLLKGGSSNCAMGAVKTVQGLLLFVVRL